MNDNDIVELYWERNEVAISATAEKYGGYLLTISNNILQNNADAKECVNDAYYRAWESMPPERPLRLSAYLAKIVRNLSLEQYKKRHAKKRGRGQVELALSELDECIPSAVSLEEREESRLILDEIHNYLYAQTDLKQIVFVQRYWYVMPIKDIAAKNDMSKTYVTSLLGRMRKELKTHLEEEGVL